MRGDASWSEAVSAAPWPRRFSAHAPIIERTNPPPPHTKWIELESGKNFLQFYLQVKNFLFAGIFNVSSGLNIIAELKLLWILTNHFIYLVAKQSPAQR
jgi:hypothetical protein